MSAPYDCDRDVPTFTRLRECDRCGVEYQALYQDAPPMTLREPELLDPCCAACEELGTEPGYCPQFECKGLLRGARWSWAGRVALFKCDDCDWSVFVETLRALLFGRACAEIVNGFDGVGRGERWLCNAIDAKARELGVLPR